MSKRLASILTPNLRWFMLAMILANIAGQMSGGMMSLYLVELGASVPQVGLVFTLVSLVPTFLQILGGWLSDTVGRLRAIALGSSISTLGWAIVVLAPSWGWLVLGLGLESVARSMVAPSFGPYIAEQSSEEQRGRVFGLTKGLFGITAVVGPVLAGALVYRWGFRFMLAVAALLYAVATAMRIWMAIAERFAPSRRAQRPTLGGLRGELSAIMVLLLAGGVLTWIWVTDAIRDAAFNMIGQLFPIYLADIGGLNVAQIGLLNSAVGVAVILATLVGGWLSDRWSERVLIAGGFAIQALGLVALLRVSGVVGLVAAATVFGLGLGALGPAYDALISKVVPEEKRGLAFGFFGTSLGLLTLPFPWIGAQLWHRFGPPIPFWLTTLACVISIPIALRAFVLPAKGPPGQRNTAGPGG